MDDLVVKYSALMKQENEGRIFKMLTNYLQKKKGSIEVSSQSRISPNISVLVQKKLPGDVSNSCTRGSLWYSGMDIQRC